MIRFLRKLFGESAVESAGRSAQREKLTIQELRERISQRMLALDGQVRAFIDERSRAIEEHRVLLREALENLETAQLRNPNLPEKALHFMQGNRTSYVKLTRLFERDIALPKDAHGVRDSLREFEQHANRLSMSNARAYQILQQFFANETGAVHAKLRDMSREFEALAAYEPLKRYESLHELMEHIGRREKDLAELHGARESLDALKKKEAHARAAVGHKEKELESFLAGDEYRECIELEDDVERELAVKKRYEKIFMDRFMVLEKPLRKFAHQAFEEEQIINAYLKDPMDALVHDFELRIVKTLAKLKIMLESGKIEVEQKRRERMVATINELTTPTLAKYLTDYNMQSRKHFDAQQRLAQNSARVQETRLRADIEAAKQELAMIERERADVSARATALERGVSRDSISDLWLKETGEAISVTGLDEA